MMAKNCASTNVWYLAHEYEFLGMERMAEGYRECFDSPVRNASYVR